MLVNPGTPSRLPGRAAELPKRTLGKTGVQVPALALGTWPCGMCKQISVKQVTRLVGECLELGITYIDAARAYRKAEDGIGLGLRSRRDEVFLTSKVWADTAEEARESLETSLRKLKTDHVDLLLLHSVGNRDLDRVPGFLRLIATGQFDVVMPAMNFVDRYTYDFEGQVLPKALERGMGVACMKVFGGMRGGFEVATGPNTGPNVGEGLVGKAIRYALGLPGVATLVIGVHSAEQLRQNARLAAEATPLSEQEKAELAKLGRRMAKKWGAHLGPVS
jgi:aryl-alcohol dehydrogenase-like predicted oxidoreductase